MFQKVVVIGRAGFDTETVAGMLAEDPMNDVEVYATAGQAITRLKAPDISLVVLNFELFNKDKFGLVQQLRDLGYGFPMLVFARIISADSYKLVESLPRALVLEKPCEKKRLMGVVQKLVGGKNTGQPQHRRYFTDQQVHIESYDAQKKLNGNIYNLSKGGAYIECDDDEFDVGDLVRFSVRLTELAKRHTVSGRVVWATGTGEQTGRPGIGVSFLKSGDVYQDMLKKL